MTPRPSRLEVDVVILGGGMAGATIAAHLAPDARVAIVEREAVLGYHTTGRSAAMFIPTYGGPAIAGLTAASLKFFLNPPGGFGHALLTRRPVMHVATDQQLSGLDGLVAVHGDEMFERLDADAARERVPILRPGAVSAALIEHEAGDLDVAGLHAGFLRQAREAAGRVLTGGEGGDIEFTGSRWRVRGRGYEVSAPVLVNATGAWADDTAIAAGVDPLGLTPFRRTVMLVRGSDHAGFSSWPVVKDVEERFYFRPFGERLLITPADETPSPPCDAVADELDIAVGMARFQATVDLPVRSLAARWAGLRTFAPDRAPVVGWSRSRPGFFWLAGLGGFGIQTAPAIGRLAAALIRGRGLPGELADHGVQPELYAPGRFEAAA